jgi:GalNAc5-diNAcBac-PP-undecaprenol beta-1,3-glucosyltransferase
LNPSIKATVLIPTMRGRGPLLPYSVGSVLAQTVPDIEVFIIGDGVDEETRTVIRNLMQRDSRIKFFDHPKHESRGEPNRHAALAEARGEIVCYLCDRDLMLPNHVDAMRQLLTGADFAHTLIAHVLTGGTLECVKEIDIGRADDRRRISSRRHVANGIPLSFAGHTLAMYRKLPYGWRTTPERHFTDIYMWEQFLDHPECRAKSGTAPTILYFSRWRRGDWPVDQKAEELKRWSDSMAAPDWNLRFLQQVIDGLEADRLEKAHQRRIWFYSLRLAYWKLRRICGIDQ